MVWFSPFSTSSCCDLLVRCLPFTMNSGKKVGKLVKKYLKGKTVANGRRSMRLSMSSRSSSDGSSFSSGCDEAYWDDEDVPEGVPKGCLAVYVGLDMRRFVIQASFLEKQVFRELLRQSEEEYGFGAEGGLRIPCEAGVFEQLLWQLETEGSVDDSF